MILQNQLGNKPKRCGKRGVVVQADPKTRQYKVMTFGSRRLTLRNRKFLRKCTPIHTPPGMPTAMQLVMRLGGQRPEPNTESGATPGTREAAVNASPVPAQVIQFPVSKTIPDQYSLPPAPEQQSKNLSSVQPPPSPRTSTACWEWLGGTLSRSAGFTTTD